MFKISLTGDLGSGKSTVCDLLQKQISATVVSVGAIMRKRAKEKKLTLADYSKYMETHPEEDKYLDDMLSSYDSSVGDYIFDSRMAWHFVPSAFSFYLKVSIDESARRVFDAKRDDETFCSVEKTKEMLLVRRKSEQQRYSDFYSVDILDMKNYDAVIETDGKTPQQVAEEIIKIYQERR